MWSILFQFVGWFVLTFAVAVFAVLLIAGHWLPWLFLAIIGITFVASLVKLLTRRPPR